MKPLGEKSLLVGIPDLTVKGSQTTTKQPINNIAVAQSPTQLQTV